MNEFSYAQRHMGTDVSLSFVCGDRESADRLAKTAFSTIKAYEQQFSRFLPTSELSQLNQSGAAIVSEIFFTVLKRSLELTELTHGAFNPLVQVARLGYQSDYKDLPAEAEVVDERYSTDITRITLDEKTKRVTLATGQQLDFGGFLKGYLAALLADRTMSREKDCQGCIINIGGDLATRGYDQLHKPFIFFLYNPVTREEVPIAITDASLATSGTYARRWRTNQGMQNHIVDTVTLKNPAVDAVSVSLITKDGAMSEALTKLFLTRGEKEAIGTASPDTHEYQYFFVTKSGDIKSNIT